MIYSYRCFNCNQTTDVIKSVKDIDRAELHTFCGALMTRVMSFQGHVNGREYQAHYSPAFGKVITSDKQVQNEIRKLNGEKGMDVHEVGNEKIQKPKPKTFNYDTLRSAAKDFERVRNAGTDD